MAKHDQRILKFLNQNADRPPTITEMMTRLNISISDISDSLSSLQAQGLISKKVNNQGIEVWFPGGAPQAAPQAAPAMAASPQISERLAPQRAPLAQATAQMPAMGGPIAVETRGGPEVRSPFHAERSAAAPDPQPPAPRPISLAEREPKPVQVQHMHSDPAPAPRAPENGGLSNLPQQPAFNGASSMSMYGLAPAPRGVGILTLLAGLVAAVGLSAFITTRIVAKEVRKASAGYVDRKALAEANAALADFQEKTKAHVAALEAEVKKLSGELAVSKSATDSLKMAAATAPAAKEPAAAPKAGKAAKAAEEPKSSKAKKTAAAKPKQPAVSAMAKAAARGAAMRKKAPKPVHESSGDSPSSAGSDDVSSAESPGVPNPPGLDELPPPPSE